MPGARCLKIVTISSTAATSAATSMNVIIAAQKSSPASGEYSCRVSGGYANHPPVGGTPAKYAAYRLTPAIRYTQ